MTLREFYSGKRVLVTGHNGFKGTWLCRILVGLGAEVYGYSTARRMHFFSIAGLDDIVHTYQGDVRDYETLKQCFNEVCPEIVIHMAAQPLVRDSYDDPVYTYETNVLGTVNLLECVRKTPGIISVLNVTTDKVYRNNEWERGYIETDSLDGFDPYSNSKSCSELVTFSYYRSFLHNARVPVSTSRAGNVIGGGDMAKDRIIPDCIRAVNAGERIFVRNPNSVRPYQHVLEPLYAYLLIVMKQAQDLSLSGCYNVGPKDSDCLRTSELVDAFCEAWGNGAQWYTHQNHGPHEANLLRLDCTKIKEVLGWSPRLSAHDAVKMTVDWAKTYYNSGNIPQCMDCQIRNYFGDI